MDGLKEIWSTTDAGNWQHFVELTGRPNVKRKSCLITVEHIWSDRPNRYQEATGNQLYGN